jgi:hypothetical protein
MKKTGLITLYNQRDVRLSFYRYADLGHMNTILKYWQNAFGDRYRHFYYQISPDIHTDEMRLKKAS